MSTQLVPVVTDQDRTLLRRLVCDPEFGHPLRRQLARLRDIALLPAPLVEYIAFNGQGPQAVFAAGSYNPRNRTCRAAAHFHPEWLDALGRIGAMLSFCDELVIQYPMRKVYFDVPLDRRGELEELLPGRVLQQEGTLSEHVYQAGAFESVAVMALWTLPAVELRSGTS